MIPLTDGMLIIASFASMILGLAFSLMYKFFSLTVEIFKSCGSQFIDSLRTHARGRSILSFKSFKIIEIKGLSKEIIRFICVILAALIVILANYILLDGAGRLVFPLSILLFAVIFARLKFIKNERLFHALTYLISLPALSVFALILCVYRCLFCISQFLCRKSASLAENNVKNNY